VSAGNWKEINTAEVDRVENNPDSPEKAAPGEKKGKSVEL